MACKCSCNTCLVHDIYAYKTLLKSIRVDVNKLLYCDPSSDYGRDELSRIVYRLVAKMPSDKALS